MTEPMALDAKALVGVDPQVLTAAREMDKAALRQPKWVWHSNDDVPLTTHGRWQKSDTQAPYVRADLVLRAIDLSRRLPPPAAGEGLEPVGYVDENLLPAIKEQGRTDDIVIWEKPYVPEHVPLYAATPAARAAVLEPALRNLLASVDAVLVELKPGQSLSPAGAGRTNALEAARNEARRALKEKT